MTDRASYRFTVKEYSDGTPWIMLEPHSENLEVFGKGFLGLDLPDGTSYEGAQKISRYLNDNLKKVSFTKL